MTVVAVEKGEVRCIWHSASAEALCSALIPAAALDHIDLADDEDLEDEEEED
jgi:transcriptional regulator of met regulon